MAAYFRDLYTNDINKHTIISHFRLVGNIASKIKSQSLDKPPNSDFPVLIFNSDDDVSFSPKAQKALLDSYPNVREHRFKSGGHTLFGRREELYSTISDFLTGK